MFAVLFGSIGMGYIVYGRKQKRGVALLSGIALCAFSYFVPNVFLVIVIGIALMSVPYFIRH